MNQCSNTAVHARGRAILHLAGRRNRLNCQFASSAYRTEDSHAKIRTMLIPVTHAQETCTRNLRLFFTTSTYFPSSS